VEESYLSIKRCSGIPSKIIIIMFILLFFVNQIIVSGKLTNIVINEVMYDPEPNDNYNEWVELYNPTNQSINVSGWSIVDNYADDFLEVDLDHGNGTTIIPPNGYAIIADHGTTIYENFSIPDNAIRIYVDDAAIGNGLGNDKDKMILKNSTGQIIDTIEWGYNYSDVPGEPADVVNEGHSLARYQDTDTNDSSKDFYEGIIPTPGSENTFVSPPHINIKRYPLYLPKIQNNTEYGLPFAININISNYAPNESYQLKSYVVGNISSSYPATQTWNGNVLMYSDRYTSSITTDEYGNWSGWQYLRFKEDYQEYKNHIEKNNTAYLKAKIKKDNSSDEISKNVFLLDMDESTSNGTIGGCAIGIAETNNTVLQNKTIIIENRTGAYAGAYATEDNKIDEGFVSTPGYYKLPVPCGSGYIIKFLDQTGTIIHLIQNVTIEQGEYRVEIPSSEISYMVRRNETLDIQLTVRNTGDFSDIIDLNIGQISNGWQATLEQEKLSLDPGEIRDINVHIIPCQENGCRYGSVSISATSEKDVGAFDEITFQLEILAPDLNITTIKMYDENGEQITGLGEGETVQIKAFLKNTGNENATDVTVMFYYDIKDEDHFIGSKYYDLVGKYQKYPSVEWDTKDVKPGNHTIFIIVDEENHIDELDENNNERTIEMTIYNTSPTSSCRSLLITEVYYNTHPNIKNEFVALYNPTNQSVNLSGWYITNQPLKQRGEQTKSIFPENTTIPTESRLYITQNASAYLWETGEKPDFEYKTDSDDNVPQMDTDKTMTLSNAGGMVALKDWYNHTIDIIVYGKSDHNCTGWNGSPVPSSGTGVILKRNVDHKNQPIDTNTSDDWLHPRRYGIGQSDFPYVDISFYSEITTFVSPDCSFQTIVNELRKANESIYFNIYEFTNPFLCDELVDALKRNVSIHVFVEGSPVGGIPDNEKFILNKIANYGGSIRSIVNDKENNVYARYTFDHGKYLVIDNRTVIVESCNWAKTGIPIDPTYGNREWGIIIRSKEVAAYFLDVFLDDWNPQRCDSYSFDDMNLSVPADFYMDKSVFTGAYIPQFESKTLKGNCSVTPVFSPDTSLDAICHMIESANESIYIEQLYIYKNWDDRISPFVERLVNKSKQGVDVKIILNYNPYYESTNEKCNQTKLYFEENGIEVKFIYTNWSYFTNVHNKGMIIDNKSVLISSINWNENSVTRNREAGIIIENEDVARYYAEVFFYDWNLMKPHSQNTTESDVDHKNTIYIGIIFTMTFAIIARDWRKREWT
jgi:cardiolipin synthase